MHETNWLEQGNTNLVCSERRTVHLICQFIKIHYKNMIESSGSNQHFCSFFKTIQPYDNLLTGQKPVR